MNERETVTVREVSKMLGISPQAVREQMKAGVLPIGDVYENSTGNGYRYLIYREKLNRHIGKDTQR